MKVITDEYAWLDDPMNHEYADKYARYITEHLKLKGGISEEHQMNILVKYANKVTRFGLISMRALPMKKEYQHA